MTRLPRASSRRTWSEPRGCWDRLASSSSWSNPKACQVATSATTRPTEPLPTKQRPSAMHWTGAAFGSGTDIVRYPDRGPDLAIVSERLWDRPDGAATLQLIVRDPVSPPPPGIGRQRDRSALFGAVADREAWLGHADRIVVAAARDQASLVEVTRPGYAWLMSDGRAPRWQVTRELALEDGAWVAAPDRRRGRSQRAPHVRPGHRGVAGRRERGGCPGPLVARMGLDRSLAAGSGSRPGGRPLRAPSQKPFRPAGDRVQPRNFVVTPDRAWHLIAQDLTMRFALPREVLAFRGIVRPARAPRPSDGLDPGPAT